MGGLRGRRTELKRKKDSWTWTTVWWLLGERIRVINGNGKNTISLIGKLNA